MTRKKQTQDPIRVIDHATPNRAIRYIDLYEYPEECYARGVNPERIAFYKDQSYPITEEFHNRVMLLRDYDNNDNSRYFVPKEWLDF